jgi:pimeloyl-ACP methyl ester carboxylesterase
MRCWSRRGIARVAALSAALTVAGPTAGNAQPPASNPNEMCGDGTTFAVHLPGVAGSLGPGVPVNAETVTLPNGCSIYAIFVSGYSVNPMLNYLSFYKLAKFIAERNGYVHYAWWNNFMGEYLRGPLHGDDLAPALTPGGATHGLGFVPQDAPGGPPKAVPEEDVQFQADAKRVIAAIRQHNPNAVIVVAGHSMGGNAVVRLGATTSTRIDVLAPIDPVGNRSSPVGTPVLGTYNWTRWRVANELLGYRQRDCERIGPLCRDFDPRPFRFTPRCIIGPLLSEPPLVGSRAPLQCPQAHPIVVTQRPRIRANVRMLYHRWQKEFPFPFDVLDDEPIDRGPLTGLLGGNYQQPLLRNAPGESDPNKSCGVLPTDLSMGELLGRVLLPGFVLPDEGPQPRDPRDPDLSCSPYDGHGEIVGLRGALVPHAVRAPEWPCYTGVRGENASDRCGSDGETRRHKLVKMADAATSFPHEPDNPDLDMVADDLITIVQHVLDEPPAGGDDTAPATLASLLPAANAAGWHTDDVQVEMTASDEGSGVEAIEHSTTGAQMSGPVVTAGAAAQALITAEGLTSVLFFARDQAGNVESAQEIVVRIDKTAPEIGAETSPTPNQAGWFRHAVTVSFPAFDSLSGIAGSSPDVTVTTEGAGHEVLGTAEDMAGNLASVSATLNIDLTAPAIVLSGPANGATFLLNAPAAAEYECTDALSGVASCHGSLPDGAALDTTVPGSHSFTVDAADVAGNLATTTHTYAVRYGFSGFAHPIVTGLTTVNAGRVVPVKYALYDARAQPVSDLASFVSIASAAVPCDGTAGEAARADAAGHTALRYDRDAGHFIFNWRTAKSWAGSCRALELTLSDGTTHTAVFRFR